MTKLVPVLAVAAMITTVNIACAGAAYEPRSKIVRFSDLDMNSTRGIEVLLSRIKFAAEDVCRDLDLRPDLASRHLYRDCVQSAMRSAVEKIDRPTLAAYANAHGVRSADDAIEIVRNN